MTSLHYLQQFEVTFNSGLSNGQVKKIRKEGKTLISVSCYSALMPVGVERKDL